MSVCVACVCLPTLDPQAGNAIYAHLVNGKLCRLLLFEVHKAVALALTCCIHCHLAGQDVAEGAEGIVQCLVVNALVQVLDEDVAHP